MSAITTTSLVFAIASTVIAIALYIIKRHTRSLREYTRRRIDAVRPGAAVAPEVTYEAAVRRANARAVAYIAGGLVVVPAIFAAAFLFASGLANVDTRLLGPMLAVSGVALGLIIVFVLVREGILGNIYRQNER